LLQVPDVTERTNHELSFGVSRPDAAAAMKQQLHIIQHFDLKKGIITFAEIEVTETPDNIYLQLTESEPKMPQHEFLEWFKALLTECLRDPRQILLKDGYGNVKGPLGK
jgi:hypothetical protein